MKLLLNISVILFIVLSFSGLSAQEISHNHSVHYGFIENKGQWPSPVLLKAKVAGANMWVQQNKFVFHVQDFAEMHLAHLGGEVPVDVKNRQDVVHFNFVHSNFVTEIEKEGKSSNYFNYFLGNDKSKWASNVHGYSSAVLKNLYDGIDLKLIEQQEELKYEFHVAPKVSPNVIQINIAGAQAIFIDAKGKLNVKTKAGDLIEEKPYAYQIKNGKIVEVACQFELRDSILTFKLGQYDARFQLIIDPTLVFATYSGSVTDNFGMTATYAHDGSAFSGGTIYGNNYPTPDGNAFDITSSFTVPSGGYGITDVFISKYSADGSTMLWTTFLGGGNNNDGTETVHSLIADKDDNLYLYGVTSSLDFPIVNGYQPAHAGGTSGSNYYYNGVYYNNNGTDIYVAKLSANGHQLLGSTYMGGSGNDGLNYKVTSGIYGSFASYDSLTNNYGDQFRGEIMLDQNGDCIVATNTRSVNFPTKNAFQPTLGGGQDGVIFKLTSDLSDLMWSSYYGGSNNDACYSVKVDSSYNIVIGGGTSSSNLPGTAGGWKSSYQGGKTDGFILKLTPDGQTIQQATYVGTNNLDQVFFIEIDRFDKIYAFGQSAGGQFPVVNSTYSNAGSSQFVAKFNETLTAIENSTVFGNGSSVINISPSAFMVDICGNIYTSGWGANILQNTPLSGMAITPNAFQATPPNGFDFYFMVLKRDFTDIIYGSYLGGNKSNEHVDGGTSRFDKNGVIYQSVCGGCPAQSDFPTTPGAWSNYNLSSNCNNILFKFDFNLIPIAKFSTDKISGCAPFTVEFDNQSSDSDKFVWDFGDGDLDSTTFNPIRTFENPGNYLVKLYVTDSICELTDSAFVNIFVDNPLDIVVSEDVFMCHPSPVTLTASSSGNFSMYHWSTNNQFTDQLNATYTDSTITVTPTESTTYYVQASNLYCSVMDSVRVEFTSTNIQLQGNDNICWGDQSTILVTNINPSLPLTYTWSPTNVITAGSASDSLIVIKPDSSMYIYVTASTNDGCVFTDSIWINVNTITGVDFVASAEPTHVLKGNKTTLSVTPSTGYNYSWTPAEGIENPNSAETDAVVNQTTIYKVTASDGFCSKSDTVIVYTEDYVCDEPFVYLPNAFTPNGDGDNDILYLRSAITHEVLLRIFDRWGELVFETDNQHIGWDGTFKGKPCNPDVYDYYLKVKCIDNQENIIKGNVTLIR